MEFSEAELGPKMQACSEMERKFVWAYLRLGGKSATEAARDAGYADPGRRSASIRVQAHHLMQRERVIAALEEVGRKSFRGLLAPAVSAMRALIERPDHPDHARTVATVLSRLGLGERSGVDVNVTGEVLVNHTDEAVDQLRLLRSLGVPRDKLVETFGFSGLERYERMLGELDGRAGPKLIEGKVVDGHEDGGRRASDSGDGDGDAGAHGGAGG